MSEKVYRIYTGRNWAETSRDRDQIEIVDLAYRKTEEEAVDFAKNYIKENFCLPRVHKKDVELERVEGLELVNGQKLNNAKYAAYDSGSWAETLIIDEIEVGK